MVERQLSSEISVQRSEPIYPQELIEARPRRRILKPIKPKIIPVPRVIPIIKPITRPENPLKIAA
ncbi:hypothetical protein HYS93_01020 [Candidatus Daviesbacteria bacterium]|nr:hypothetical protein [Candidatus Daviesbacteria bacterium]